MTAFEIENPRSHRQPPVPSEANPLLQTNRRHWPLWPWLDWDPLDAPCIAASRSFPPSSSPVVLHIPLPRAGLQHWPLPRLLRLLRQQLRQSPEVAPTHLIGFRAMPPDALRFPANRSHLYSMTGIPSRKRVGLE